MKTAYAVSMKYAGIIGRAHEKNGAYVAAHHNAGRRLLVLGDCREMSFLLTEKNDCMILHADDPDKTVPLVDHEIVELGDGGPVFEAISDSTPAKPPAGVRIMVLSGGYLSDFVRVPRVALIISSLLILAGIALAAIGNRRVVAP